MLGAKSSRLRPKHGQVSGSSRSFRLCVILSRLSMPPRMPSNVAKMPVNAVISFDTLNRPSLTVRSVFGTAAGKLAEAGVEIQGYECRCGAPYSGCAGVTSFDIDKRRPPRCISPSRTSRPDASSLASPLSQTPFSGAVCFFPELPPVLASSPGIPHRLHPSWPRHLSTTAVNISLRSSKLLYGLPNCFSGFDTCSYSLHHL